MSEQISQLQQVGLELADAAGDATTTFSRGMIVSKYTANPGKQSVARVPQVIGTKSIMRVTGPGPLDYDVSMDFPLDAGMTGTGGLGDILATLFGSDSPVNLGSGRYKHVFYILDSAILPWLNLFSTKDNVKKQILGWRADQIKFSFKSSDGHCMVSASGIAVNEQDYNSSTPFLAFSSQPLMIPAMTTTLTLAGTTILNIDEIDITLKNTNERFRPIRNSRVISQAYNKAVEIEIAMKGLNFSSETFRTAYKNITAGPAFVMTITDTATTPNVLNFRFPTTYVKAFEGPNISDTDLMKINMTLLSTGDNTNNTISVTNSYSVSYDTGAAIS